MLSPKNTCFDKAAYDAEANKLAIKFYEYITKFEEYANDEIMDGATESNSSILNSLMN